MCENSIQDEGGEQNLDYKGFYYIDQLQEKNMLQFVAKDDAEANTPAEVLKINRDCQGMKQTWNIVVQIVDPELLAKDHFLN